MNVVREPMQPYFVNRFTQRFGQIHPFACAGMGFAGMAPELAIAVSRAGGIGALGVGLMPSEELRSKIRAIRAAGDWPFNINFLTCFDNDAQIRVCAEERVPIVSFHWGHPAKEHLELLRDAGASVWEQVGTVEAGKLAADAGIEVVIAQGWEAGGHNYGGLGTMALAPAMVDAIGDKAMVLAAGGIVDGRGVAAALMLGVDGVSVGTRLVASEEAHVHPFHHQALVRAGGSDTVRSSIFGPEMPAFNPMRVIRNRVVDEYTERLAEVPMERSHLPIIGETVVHGQRHVKRKFDVMLPVPETTGDFEEMPWLAGEGVGLIHEILPASTIVSNMMSEAAKIIRHHAGSFAS
jgi:NAD(P)H-dependent flavin oxidoreductase YrpB (nitropropane dioxygenase family)